MISTETDTLTRTRHPRQHRIKEAVYNPLIVRRRLNDVSLHNFIEYYWDEVSTDEFKTNWHIKYLCRQLEEVAERVARNLPKQHDLIINIPPGTTKTITCSIMFPVWCWTKWFKMRFITASYSAALSLESAEYSRDLVRSDKFKAVYPELAIKEDKDTKSNFKVQKSEPVVDGRDTSIKHGGNRYSTSVGGTLTGFHGHILIIDDPLNPEQAVSEKELANANHWMDHTLPTRKTDKAVSTTILVMQRLHQNDPSGHILNKQKKNVKHISLPGEIRNYGEQVKPAELKEEYKEQLLDPVRMSWEVLEDLETDLGQYGYAGQIGQKPTPPGGGMFKVDHLNVITHLPASVNFLQTIRYWDKAGTQDGGAWTVGVKISKLTNQRYVVEDVVRGQWSSEVREKVIRQTAEADGTKVQIGVEQEGGSGGKESAEGTVRNLAGFSVFVDSPTGDKVYRADPFSVQVNNGNVMLLHGTWNAKYVDELDSFPFSTFKDQVDASSGSFNKLTRKKVARRVV